QFAAAFAVLGRLEGLPTRVVVGFEVPSGQSTVYGRDGYAWPEVLFPNIGWVPFDPMPPPGSTPRALEDDYKPALTSPSVAPTGEDASATPAPEASDATSPVITIAQPVTGPGFPLWTLAAAVGALAVVLLAVTILARVRVSSRRLHRGGTRERLGGAWLEL